MKAIRFTIKSLIIIIFIVTLSVAVLAQTRTFVSGLGSDANPCSRTAPCRTFQQAHNVVVPGGEVVALDSAGYGQLTITKSVTITGDGVYAGISASAGDAVTIATAGITVNLRSLTIEGLGSATNGINATDFTVLHIENCIVNGFATHGIGVEPSAAGTRKVFIKDSISRKNGVAGIALFNAPGGNPFLSGTALIATVEGTRTENNGAVGISSYGLGAIVTASGCLSSGNGGGLEAGVGAVLNIESSVASNNSYIGIFSSSGIVRVSNSTVTNNGGLGFVNVTGGIFESRGNNTVDGNNGGGAQTQGTITPITGT